MDNADVLARVQALVAELAALFASPVVPEAPAEEAPAAEDVAAEAPATDESEQG